MSVPFDLRQLRYFVAVAETSSFRRAAERLHISQPPLSRQIRALEESLGVRLFERTTAAVKLTREGEVALRRARKLIADAGSLAEAMGKLAGDRGVPRIGVSVAIAVADRRRLSAAWKRALGADRLHLEFAETTALLPRLRRGHLDYALLGAIDEMPELALARVHTVPLLAILPRAHPAARKTILRLKDLAATPFFWFSRRYNPSYYDHCARIFERKGFAPPFVTVDPGQIQTLQRIASGEGCTLMSRSQLSTPTPGVVSRKLEEGVALAIPIAAAWRRGGDPEREKRALAFAKAASRVLGAG